MLIEEAVIKTDLVSSVFGSKRREASFDLLEFDFFLSIPFLFLHLCGYYPLVVVLEANHVTDDPSQSQTKRY